MPLPGHLIKRGKTYTVRYVIPKELQFLIGKREIARVTGCTDLKFLPRPCAFIRPVQFSVLPD